MHFPHKPKGVIFDMDGLLIDTIPLYITAMISAGRDVGYPLSSAYVLSLVGLLGYELQNRLVQDLGAGFPIEDFLHASTKHLALLLDHGAPLKAGAADFIHHLSATGIPLAVATSLTGKEAEHHLERADLRRFFHAVVGRDAVQRSKPHPDLYLKAVSLLQLQPERCIALEDSFTGIRSAHSAGCMVIMVPDVLTPTDEIKALCVGIARNLQAVHSGFEWGQ